MRRALAISISVVAAIAAGCGNQTSRPRPTGMNGSAPAPGSPTPAARPAAPAAVTTNKPGAGRVATHPAGSTAAPGDQPAVPKAHPQAIEPVAGVVPQSSDGTSDPAAASVAPAPGSAVAQPVSDAVIRRELQASGLSANPGQATLTRSGLAIAPVDAPGVVQRVIAAGNAIAHLPYRFGGGHGTFEDNAYDCSGSLSFVFAAAGLLGATVTSGELMGWGQAGPGRWITVFAAPGHTFMYVAGLRFDTVALAETGSRWSDRPAGEPDLASFVVRHPLGL